MATQSKEVETTVPGDVIASPMVCYALRLRPGEELKAALAAFSKARGIKAGFIISCVGSVRDVSLRLAGAERPRLACSPTKQANALIAQPVSVTRPSNEKSAPYSASRVGQADLVEGSKSLQENHQQEEQPMLHTGPDARFELLSLVGTLSSDGLHLHVSLGDEEGAVCGGHLVRAIVNTTAELVIGEAPSLNFSRAMDPDTGFKELVVSGRDTVKQNLGSTGDRETLPR